MRRFAKPGLVGSIFRQHLPLLTALVVGLAVALVSAKYLYTYVNTNKEMTRVPVPAYNIPPYTVITPQDITWKEVVKGAEEPGTISDPSEAAGKISLSTLYQGEQIRRERLADAGLLLNRQVLSINVDVTRCVGGALKMGDLVNVWWVIDPSQPTGWQLAAADAVVLDIRDSAGRSLLAQQGPVQSLSATFSQVQSSAPPAVVIMAVYPQDVSRIVGGASPKSQNAVLVKKYAQGREEVSDVAVKQNEQTAKQQQTQQSHGG